MLRRGCVRESEVCIRGQDGDFWKMERKAEQATEGSGVGCRAWSGGFQKSWRNSADLCVDESNGPHGLRRSFGPVFVKDLRGEIAESLVRPPGVLAVEPAIETGLQHRNSRVLAQADF